MSWLGERYNQPLLKVAYRKGFSLIFGSGREVGHALVTHPTIKAAGFTGSQSGGLALWRAAQSRAEPIPFYAEMSSINPVFLMPEALKSRGATLGEAFIGSMNMGRVNSAPTQD